MVVNEGKNIFFTGAAGMWLIPDAPPPPPPESLIECICRQGTGKSLLLRTIIAALRKKHVKKTAVVPVTAHRYDCFDNWWFVSFPLRSESDA